MLRLSNALLVVLLLAAGLALRTYDLDDPPLDFHPVRQLHSALIARGMYYQDLPGVPEWQREMAVQQWRSEGQIEPLVMETLAVWGYRMAGSPQLWIPRLLAGIFWVVGAVFVFLLARRFTGFAGALLALWFMLIWPYSVSASRAFQPDPLMVALAAVALWAAVRWAGAEEAGHSRVVAWAALAGLLAGLAIYVKLVAVFIVAPPLAVLVLRGSRTERLQRLRSRHVWLLAALAVLPFSLYFIDGMYISGTLREQFTQRFFPHMWVDPAFYLRWIGEMSRVIPFELALAAVVGALLVRRGLYRAVLLSLWAGYLAYGMALPHHIGTHDYYHLPLFIPVSLGLGALADLAYSNLRGPAWLVRAAAVGGLLAALLITGYGARNMLKRSDFRPQADLWQQAGQRMGPQSSVAALTDDYATGLKYWGWSMPLIWPTADDLAWQGRVGTEYFAEYFERLAAGSDYFVVSPLAELERQPELAQALSRYPVDFESGGMRIYDLRPAAR